MEFTLAAIEKAKADYKSGAIKSVKKNEKIKISGSIKRSKPLQQDTLANNQTIAYQLANLNINLYNKNLSEFTPPQLLSWVIQVVETESPIHKREVARRITEGAGLKRTGIRIQTAIEKAISHGLKVKQCLQKGDFVWQASVTPVRVRDRSGLDSKSKNIEFVAPEEINAAIIHVVGSGFSLSEEDAISNAANLLGFQRVVEKINVSIKNQLRLLLANKVLVLRKGLISKFHSLKKQL